MSVNASEIIAEIASLPPRQQREVIRFTRKLDEQDMLSPAELGALAKRLADCADGKKAAGLRQKLMNGFYGRKRHA